MRGNTGFQQRDSFLQNISTRNNMSFITFRGKDYQSPKYMSEETLHAHFSSVEDTWKIIEPHLRRSGVTRLANHTGLDRVGIPVVNAIRPNLEGYSVAHGKGMTLEAAKLSAAMESLERYYGTTTEFPVFIATYNELKQSYTVIPEEKLALSKCSFFHADLPLKWTLGWDIVNQEEIPVPLELAALLIAMPPERLLLFQISSNGLGAGTNFLEAVTQALLEVIERDAVTCSTLAAQAINSGNPLHKISLGTIPYPQVQELIQQIERVGILVTLFDNTVDTKVPAYNCYLFDTVNIHYGMTHGMGASLDPCTAMIRAITEAVQARSVFHAGVRDIFFHDQYAIYKAVNSEPYTSYVKKSDQEELDVSELRSEATATFEGDIAACLEKLRNVGLEQVIVFELTEPESDLVVVKVVVPGLEGYLHRYHIPGQRGKAYLNGRDASRIANLSEHVVQ
jgi:YcaO-like protein with predicted kinase domain